MKVCMVSGTYPFIRGGIADYTRLLCRSLVRLGCDVSVVTSARPEISTDLDSELRVMRVIPEWGASSLVRLYRVIQYLQPDIVHFQYNPGNYGRRGGVCFAPWLSRLTTCCTIVFTFHDLQVPTFLPKITNRVRKVLAIALPILASHRAIVTNEKDLNELRRLFPRLSTKVSVIPIGSNIKVLETPRETARHKAHRKLGLSNTELAIGFFGGWGRDKNFDVVFRALEKVKCTKNAPDFRLVMIGGEGLPAGGELERQRILELARIHGLESHLLWTGFCSPDECSEYLLAMDLCVLPYAEGVSTRRGSFLAAMVHGLPVITTARGSLPEGLKHDFNVILVRDDDEVEMARQVIHLAGCRECRKALGTNAAEFGRRFEWDNIARETLGVYRDIFESRGDQRFYA